MKGIGLTLEQYKWKYFNRISDYKWSRKSDGYICENEDIYLDWKHLMNKIKENE